MTDRFQPLSEDQQRRLLERDPVVQPTRYRDRGHRSARSTRCEPRHDADLPSKTPQRKRKATSAAGGAVRQPVRIIAPSSVSVPASADSALAHDNWITRPDLAVSTQGPRSNSESQCERGKGRGRSRGGGGEQLQTGEHIITFNS